MRAEHLKGRKEIRDVFGKGKRFGCRGAKLFVLKNDLPYNRVCFTFSRSYGNAVVRNRAKRLGREAFRLLKPSLSCGYDLILLVYPESDPVSGGLLTTTLFTKTLLATKTLSGRMSQLEFLFSKAGLLK